MISAVGQRPLGLQVGELGAILDWACHEFKTTKISLYGVGWNASIAALCTCAFNPGKVDRVCLRHYPASLKLLIEKHIDYDSCAPLFCYGLLEQFDLAELTALCWPVQPEMTSSSVQN